MWYEEDFECIMIEANEADKRRLQFYNTAWHQYHNIKSKFLW